MKLSELYPYIKNGNCIKCHNNYLTSIKQYQYGFGYFCQLCGITYSFAATNENFHICGELCVMSAHSKILINHNFFVNFNISEPDYQHIFDKYKTLVIYY